MDEPEIVRFTAEDLSLYRQNRNRGKLKKERYLSVVETINGGKLGGLPQITSFEERANVLTMRSPKSPRDLSRQISLDTLVEEEEEEKDEKVQIFPPLPVEQKKMERFRRKNTSKKDFVDSQNLSEIDRWLEDHGFVAYVDVFRREEITDWEIMYRLNLSALKLMGLTVGTSLKILNELQIHMKSKNNKLEINCSNLHRSTSRNSSGSRPGSPSHFHSSCIPHETPDSRPPWNSHFGAYDQMPKLSRPGSAIYIRKTPEKRPSYKRNYSPRGLLHHDDHHSRPGSPDMRGRRGEGRPQSPLSRNSSRSSNASSPR
ncbi:hypothetical protein HK098_004010 [Nowakowskiella sp. JEL0407]|nr:hypothetical protein HK098_004010 [Nowakowskiella sp. JEL0407]